VHPIIQMRKAASPIRLAWAAAFALLLSLRLLGSTGYMPAIDDGRLTIVACPDADANAPFALGTMHHHHGHANHNHNVCPYAAAGAMGALGADFPPLAAALIFAAAVMIGRTFVSVERQARRERPPAIGPPIPA